MLFRIERIFIDITQLYIIYISCRATKDAHIVVGALPTKRGQATSRSKRSDCGDIAQLYIVRFVIVRPQQNKVKKQNNKKWRHIALYYVPALSCASVTHASVGTAMIAGYDADTA